MTKPNYKGFYNIVKNAAKKEATIFIYGVIGGFDYENWKFINTADYFLADFAAVEDEVDTIHIKINSPGGNVWDGLAIFNAITNSKKQIITYNEGICYSMGALLMLAGDKAYANKNSLFMVHNVISAVWGNAAEMREEADVLDKYDLALGTAIEAKLGITAEEVKSKYLNYKDNYFTADEAFTDGFYDEVLTTKSKNIDNVKDMGPKDLIEHYAKMNFDIDSNKSNIKTPTPLKTNSKKMSKSYPKIEAVLNTTFEEGEAKNGIILTEQEAEVVENQLTTLETNLTTETEAKTTAEASVIALQNDSTAVLDFINDALGLEADNKVANLKDAFTAMQNKITALGNQPGETHTQVKKKATTTNPNPNMNFDTPFYNHVKKHLN